MFRMLEEALGSKNETTQVFPSTRKVFPKAVYKMLLIILDAPPHLIKDQRPLVRAHVAGSKELLLKSF